jgi:hypothetical protein
MHLAQRLCNISSLYEGCKVHFFVFVFVDDLDEEEALLWKHSKKRVASLHDTITKLNEQDFLLQDFNTQLHDEVVSLQDINSSQHDIIS